MSSVAHPSHYNAGKIEVIEFIEDQGFGSAFNRGNAIKYIARAGKKDPAKEIEDLEKAAWYVTREIEILKARKENREPLRPNAMNPRTPIDFSATGALIGNPPAPPTATVPLAAKSLVDRMEE